MLKRTAGAMWEGSLKQRSGFKPGLRKRPGKSEESITGRAAIVKNLRTWQPE